MAKSFILQRQIDGIGSKPNWGDAERYETREAAQKALEYARSSEMARNYGAGRAGARIQPMRIIKVLA